MPIRMAYWNMTKKHFIALANAIREENAHSEKDGLPLMIDNAAQITLAAFCLQQNTELLRGRWIDYVEGRCGSNGGKVKATASTTDPSDSLIS